MEERMTTTEIKVKEVVEPIITDLGYKVYMKTKVFIILIPILLLLVFPLYFY